MAIYKRGDIYWYKFMWNGKSIRESTKQTNDKVARQMEAAHRTSLAKGEVGIRDKKVVATLENFCEKRIEPWAKATFEKPAPKTWLWYRFGINALHSNKVRNGRSARLTARYVHYAGCCGWPLNGGKSLTLQRSNSWLAKTIV